jgi:hypothetical protein
MEFSKTFIDKQNRSWTVEINVQEMKRIKTICNLDIEDLISVKNKEIDAEPLRSFIDSRAKTSEVLYAILKPDLERANVSQDEFDASLSGKVMKSAKTALIQALEDFFQDAPSQIAMRGLKDDLEQMEMMVEATMEKMTELRSKLKGKTKEVVSKHLDEAFSKFVSDSPELQELIQTEKP